MFPVLRGPTVADHDCGNLITLCLLSENLTLWMHHYLHLHHHHLNNVVRDALLEKTGLCGENSQAADPSPHTPSLGTPCYPKKKKVALFSF